MAIKNVVKLALFGVVMFVVTFFVINYFVYLAGWPSIWEYMRLP